MKDLSDMTHDELVDEAIRRIGEASPDTLNATCQKYLHRGGKWAVLARLLMGEDVPQSEIERYMKAGN